MGHLRAEIRMTRRVLAALKRRIREIEGPEDDAVVEYYKPYSDELEQARTRAIAPEDFPSLCQRFPIVLVGDYHTLDQAQRAFLKLLEALEAMKVSPVIALEMVNAHHQEAVGRYLSGGLDDRDFLEEIDYFTHWGFDFTHYKPIFDHARRRRLLLYGLNREGDLSSRDQFMAHRLSELAGLHEGRPVMALVGDLHLARPHLPAALGDCGQTPLVLFQNSEDIYMRKLSAAEHPFGWWTLGGNRYLNINTPPTVKLMTYLTWLEHGGEALQMLYGYAPGNGGEEGGEIDLADTIRSYIRTLKAFFDLHLKNDDDFQVFMYNDLSFLKDPFFKKGPGRAYRTMILDGRAVYVHQDRTIYLPMLDVNRAAQESMHYLMRAALPLGSTVKAFMERIHYFASGYLASKMINPMRYSPSLREMEDTVAAFPFLKKTKERQKLARQLLVYRGVLEFFKTMASHARTFQLALAPLLELDRKTTFVLSEQIGKTIGGDLFAMYEAERLSAAELKDYIFSQSDPLLHERRSAGRLSRAQ